MERYQTVDHLLAAAGTNRRFPKSVHNNSGTNQVCDHVVELQLIKTALNRVARTYSQSDLNKLVSFFSTNVNYQYLTQDQNIQKAEAVGRLIRREPAQYYDTQYIAQVKAKWLQLRTSVANYPDFVTQMDKILQ